LTAPPSLRRDLALGLGIGVALLWLLAMAGSWIILRHEMNEIYDAALARTADRILQLPLARIPGPAPETGPSEDMSYLFRQADGTVLMGSPGADPAVFGTAPRAGFRDNADYRVFGKAIGDGSILEIADPLEERRDATRDALVILLFPAAALAPLTFLGVRRFVDARLRPAGKLAGEVALRDSGDLRPVATPGLQVELMPMEEAVNRLMRRLSDALAAERSFSSNAAHELRTPIAATLAHTQRLIMEAPDGPLRARARSIEHELKRMTRLSAKLLDLSRAEAAGVTTGSGRDLRPILSLVVEDFRRAAPDLRLTMASSPVISTIDADAFAILARNLVENALLHGLPPVNVFLDRGGVLEVSNDGPTLAPESLARLTGRFERLGGHPNGSGLGLAIVAALAGNANAKLEFRSPATGRSGGLSVLVTLRGVA
jgi:two-component system OmpR family sensor kinase